MAKAIVGKGAAAEGLHELAQRRASAALQEVADVLGRLDPATRDAALQRWNEQQIRWNDREDRALEAEVTLTKMGMICGIIVVIVCMGTSLTMFFKDPGWAASLPSLGALANLAGVFVSGWRKRARDS